MTTHKSEDPLVARAKVLNLHGMLVHWDEIDETGWIEPRIQWEPGPPFPVPARSYPSAAIYRRC